MKYTYRVLSLQAVLDLLEPTPEVKSLQERLKHLRKLSDRMTLITRYYDRLRSDGKEIPLTEGEESLWIQFDREMGDIKTSLNQYFREKYNINIREDVKILLESMEKDEQQISILNVIKQKVAESEKNKDRRDEPRKKVTFAGDPVVLEVSDNLNERTEQQEKSEEKDVVQAENLAEITTADNEPKVVASTLGVGTDYQEHSTSNAAKTPAEIYGNIVKSMRALFNEFKIERKKKSFFDRLKNDPVEKLNTLLQDLEKLIPLGVEVDEKQTTKITSFNHKLKQVKGEMKDYFKNTFDVDIYGQIQKLLSAESERQQTVIFTAIQIEINRSLNNKNLLQGKKGVVEQAAATKIQALYRGHIARKKAAEEREARKKAAIKIQALYRGRIGRKQANEARRAKEAALRQAEATRIAEEEARRRQTETIRAQEEIRREQAEANNHPEQNDHTHKTLSPVVAHKRIRINITQRSGLIGAAIGLASGLLPAILILTGTLLLPITLGGSTALIGIGIVLIVGGGLLGAAVGALIGSRRSKEDRESTTMPVTKETHLQLSNTLRPSVPLEAAPSLMPEELKPANSNSREHPSPSSEEKQDAPKTNMRKGR